MSSSSICIPCGNCSKDQWVCVAYDELLPVRLVCTGCGDSSVVIASMDDVPPLPKGKPYYEGCPTWIVQSAKPEAMEEIKPDAMKSFREQADGISAIIQNGADAIDELQESLHILSEKFVADFSAAHEVSRCMQRINPDVMTDFIAAPFFSIPAQAFNEITSERSFYVLAPIFYDKIMGAPVRTSGGFRMQLVTPYTMMTFPLETFILDSLGYPGPLDLRVMGNKIIGPDLHGTWESIPGVELDDDHTDFMPSVRIRDGLKARGWLARSGVFPWQERNMGIDDMYAGSDAINALEGHRQYAEAWSDFKRYGRIHLCWDNYRDIIDFCNHVFACVVGQKIVMLGDHVSIAKWKADAMVGMTKLKNVMYNTYDDFQSLSGLEDIPTIVVDHRNGVPSSFIRSLISYRGNVILIGDDPVMDTLYDDERANLLYTIGGGMSVLRDDGWQRQRKKAEDSTIVGDAITQLQG